MNAAVTPMMAQYLEIKAGHPDALLFYRMGDFYEMFFDDAVAAAAALEITLTKRGSHKGAEIPMCGVPAHSAEAYLLQLIRKGFRVAVCEQMESPEEAKKRGSKSVVRRAVTRLVTPGTLTEDTLLEARQNNYLAAFASVRDDHALAWTDISTGDFWVTPCAPVALGASLARLRPGELLLSDRAEPHLEALVAEAGTAPTRVDPSSFDSESGARRLAEQFAVKTLDGFGNFERAEIAAMAALLNYLELTQKGRLPNLRPPQRETASTIMAIDQATRRNLELTEKLTGKRAGSVLDTIDRTVTAGGGRLMQRRIASPSCDTRVIAERLDLVARFHEEAGLADDLRDTLRHTADIERALSRLSLDRGGPRDLVTVGQTLAAAGEMANPLGEEPLFAALAAALSGFDALADHLARALGDDPPMLARDGGFVAPGYSSELDETRALRDESRQIIAGLQKSYAEATGIASLKIRHNNVLGYFIEATKTHAQRLIDGDLSDQFIHRQTTANAARFTTVELSEWEKKIINASARALELELAIFDTVKAEILDQADKIHLAASALAALDIATANATLARDEGWCRPVVDQSRAFAITGGRHPVVEAALRGSDARSFVANDCDLSAADGQAAMTLLTGPNMAGKSTYLRQNALIALLAQTGSFVPAETAHIGVVDALFSRVGASDDLARGQSTFMVEMVETAAILNQAGERAFVILDEIGRGTATYDGLSIAWATLEHLADVNHCRGIFATHYNEMTDLATRMDGIENAYVAVKEWEGDVIFLHSVHEGAADRSYGVQVARLAGLPDAVVARATDVLHALEEGEREGAGQKSALIDDLPLFSAAPAPMLAPKTGPGPVEERMETVLPDELTPRAALDLIYELKKLSESGRGG